MSKHLPRFLILAVTLAGFPEQTCTAETFFDFKIREDSGFTSANLEEFFPVEFLRLGSSLPEAETRALIDTTWQRLVQGLADADLPPDSTHLPLPHLFESIDVLFDRQEKFESLSLYCTALPVTKMRMVRFYRIIEALLGPPDSLKTLKNLGDRNPREIFVYWTQNGHLLELHLEQDHYFDFGCQLSYYASTSEIPSRRAKRLSPPAQEGDAVAPAVMSYLDAVDSLLPGDGPAPPAQVPATLKDRLAKYSDTVGLKDKLSYRTNRYLNELHSRLQRQLQKDFSSDPVPARYERLLRIAQGRVQGYTNGATQVGAAAFLAGIDDPLTGEYLKKGLEVNLPAGVAKYCSAGLAKVCRGDYMDEVIQLMADGSDSAKSILWSLPTRQQIEELRKKRAQINDTRLQRMIEGCLEIAERKLTP